MPVRLGATGFLSYRQFHHQNLMKIGDAEPDAEYPDFISMSFIAHVAKLHTEPTTGQIRMLRLASAIDCG